MPSPLFQMLVKDMAANMPEVQEELKEQELSEDQELKASKGEAHKKAEEEEYKEFIEQEQEGVEEQSALAPEENASYVEELADVSEGVEDDSELEENIDATEEENVESVLLINSQQEKAAESKTSELEESMENDKK